MKYLKIMLFAAIMAFTFAGAKAQDAVVQTQIRHDHYRHHHHRRWHHRRHMRHYDQQQQQYNH